MKILDCSVYKKAGEHTTQKEKKQPPLIYLCISSIHIFDLYILFVCI